jgi:hypothetical protein
MVDRLASDSRSGMLDSGHRSVLEVRPSCLVDFIYSTY